MDLRATQAGEPGAARAALRAGLTLLSGGWAAGNALRRTAYRLRLKRSQRLDVPVLSVGNLAVGGTGKTPFVAWLADRLLAAGRHPGILARGYGAVVIPEGEPGGPLNDEGAVLHHVLGAGVPQRQHPARAQAGRALRTAHPEVDVLLLDDGFQHWALHRDLDIVLLDATNPFGFGHLLPRGRLREHPRALARAGVVVLTRIDLLDEAARAALLERVSGLTDASVCGARTVPTALVTGTQAEPPEVLAGASVFAVSGIGTPDAFVRTLQGLAATVVGQHTFGDHQGGTEADWTAIRKVAAAAGATHVVITRKDAVKHHALPPELSVLDIRTEMVFGEEALWRLVTAAVS